MDCCYSSSLLSLHEGLSRLLQTVRPVTETELISLAHLDGRVLAQAIHCPMQVPPADNSAMDGYAVRAEDVIKMPQTLCVVGQALAGHTFDEELKSGQCVRIMTGAVIPNGANAVIMQEKTQINEASPEYIELLEPVQQGQNIRRAGEDLQLGDVLFQQGHRVRPLDLALLASVGVAQAWVYRKPRIALLSNGDELVEPGQPLAKGQIYESNRYALNALLNRLHLDVTSFGIIADEPDTIRDAMQAASTYDAVISSGGVSVGDADYIKQILEELGEIQFWKLAIKPGKPFAYGQLGKAHYFGLPGNPVSALVTCHQLAVPALRQLSGEVFKSAPTLTAITSQAIRKGVGRMDFQRGWYETNEQGQLVVRSLGKQGSGIMSSYCQANCYLVLEQERGNVAVGESVQILPLDHLLS